MIELDLNGFLGFLWYTHIIHFMIPVALTVIFVVIVKYGRSGAVPLSKTGPTFAVVAVSFALILVATFHILEHFAQTLQFFTFAIKPAHGLIGTIDLEWVHFIYNVALFVGMVALFFMADFHMSQGWPWVRSHSLAMLFTAGVVIQGYHVVEHVVRMIQHFQTGIQGTPGILGYFINLVVLHYYFTAIVYIPIVFFFFGYNFDHYVATMLFGNVSLPKLRQLELRVSPFRTRLSKIAEKSR